MATAPPFSSSSPQTRKVWSTSLVVEGLANNPWTPMTGTSENSVIVHQRDLSAQKGDTIRLDLRAQDRDPGKWGNEKLSENESRTEYEQQKIGIDLHRAGRQVDMMSRQRSVHDLEADMLQDLGVELADFDTVLTTLMLTGKPFDVTGEDFRVPAKIAQKFRDNPGGFAGNPITEPNAENILNYTDDAPLPYTTANASLGTSAMTVNILRKAKRHAMNLHSVGGFRIQPANIGGRSMYAAILTPDQVLNLLNDASANGYSILSSTADTRGPENVLYSGNGRMEFKGSIDGIDILENTYGLYDATNALSYGVLVGRAAMHLATGNAMSNLGVTVKNTRRNDFVSYQVTSEERDHGNIQAVGAGRVFGVQRAIYGGKNNGALHIVTQGDEVAVA